MNILKLKNAVNIRNILMKTFQGLLIKYKNQIKGEFNAKNL